MDSLQQAIFRTLVYADIFDYPLTPQELYQFLITNETLSYSCFRKALSRIIANDRRIDTNKEYFFLEDRKEIVWLRKRREIFSQKKLEITKKVAEKLKLIPIIKLIGVTGALAMKNSGEDDDIDLLIVTSRKKLWLTRFLALLLIEVVGKRRKPGQKDVKDKICPNVFLDEENLAISSKERNLFTAHEVCQMKVLWEKDNTYQKFLWENRWVRKYLPNAINLKSQISNLKSKNLNPFSFMVDFLEKIAHKIQLAYMKKKRTTEKILEGQAFFHPKDCSRWVLKEYNKRISK